MSTTACWGTNKLAPCGYVYFGYGSRWDMLGGFYYRGYQVSLETLLLFAYYDYPLRSSFPYYSGLRPYIDIRDASLLNEDEYLSDQDWPKLHSKTKHALGYLRLDLPDSDLLDSWIAAFEHSAGGFLRDYPDYLEHCPNVITVNKQPYYSKMPSLEKGIPRINPEHAKILNRVYEMNERAVEASSYRNTWYGRVSDEEIKASMVQW